MNNFKNLLSSRRKELKMTQKELAEKLNVSDKTISKWETGISYPEVTLLSTVAKVLDISINDLFGVEDMKEKDLDVEEQESYNYEVINKYRNKIFLIIGLIIIGLISLFAGTQIVDETFAIIMIAIGFAIYGFSLIFFISSNVSFRSFYDKKYYTKIHDYVYAKYSSSTIIFFMIPFYINMILVNSLIDLTTNGGIILIVSIIMIMISIYINVKILIKSNFIIKNDLLCKTLLIISLVMFIAIIFPLVKVIFMPFVFILVYITIFRVEYNNN